MCIRDSSKSGHQIALGDEDGKEFLEVKDKAGNHVRFAPDGGEITIHANGTLKLGSAQAGEAVVLGDSFRAFLNTFVSLVNTIVAAFNNHTHVGNLGSPTSTPAVPIQQTQQPMEPSLLSGKVKSE